jgi:hypothetical protein
MPAVFDRDQVARVEGLLATVQELTSTLRRTSDELGREVARALYLDGTGGGTHAGVLEVENDRLRHAVQGRAVIEQATGMVMAVRGCSAEEAGGVLSTLAGAGDRTLREVAADVVATSFRLPAQPTLEPWGTAAAEAAALRPAEKAQEPVVIDVRTPSPYTPAPAAYVPEGAPAPEPGSEQSEPPETPPAVARAVEPVAGAQAVEAAAPTGPEDAQDARPAADPGASTPSLDAVLQQARPERRRLNPFTHHRR